MNAQQCSQVNAASYHLRQSVRETGQMGRYLIRSSVPNFNVNK